MNDFQSIIDSDPHIDLEYKDIEAIFNKAVDDGNFSRARYILTDTKNKKIREIDSKYSNLEIKLLSHSPRFIDQIHNPSREHIIAAFAADNSIIVNKFQRNRIPFDHPSFINAIQKTKDFDTIKFLFFETTSYDVVLKLEELYGREMLMSFVDDLSPKRLKKIIMHKGNHIIDYVRTQTDELIVMAVTAHKSAIKFVKYVSLDVIKKLYGIFSKSLVFLQYLKQDLFTVEILEFINQHQVSAFTYINDPSEENLNYIYKLLEETTDASIRNKLLSAIDIADEKYMLIKAKEAPNLIAATNHDISNDVFNIVYQNILNPYDAWRLYNKNIPEYGKMYLTMKFGPEFENYERIANLRKNVNMNR